MDLRRTTGLLYLGLFVFGMLGPLVLESILVPGDAGTTSANLDDARWLFQVSLGAWLVIVVLDLFVSGALYVLLRDRPAAAFAVAGSRLLYTAMLASNMTHLADAWAATTPAELHAALATFGRSFTVALAVFGVHLVTIGATAGPVVPKWVGVVVGLAGAAYVLDSTGKVLALDGLAALTDVFMAFAVVGELVLMGWLFWPVRDARRSTGVMA